jgi:seryl-tRNA synthetase
MENYYDPTDGGVVVPDVLLPYMGGVKKILPLQK